MVGGINAGGGIKGRVVTVGCIGFGGGSNFLLDLRCPNLGIYFCDRVAGKAVLSKLVALLAEFHSGGPSWAVHRMVMII